MAKAVQTRQISVLMLCKAIKAWVGEIVETSKCQAEVLNHNNPAFPKHELPCSSRWQGEDSVSA